MLKIESTYIWNHWVTKWYYEFSLKNNDFQIILTIQNGCSSGHDLKVNPTPVSQSLHFMHWRPLQSPIEMATRMIERIIWNRQSVAVAARPSHSLYSNISLRSIMMLTWSNWAFWRNFNGIDKQKLQWNRKL